MLRFKSVEELNKKLAIKIPKAKQEQLDNKPIAPVIKLNQNKNPKALEDMFHQQLKLLIRSKAVEKFIIHREYIISNKDKNKLRSYGFIKKKKYRFDFFIEKLNLLIEIDGGIFLPYKTGHTSGKGYERDRLKELYARIGGYKLIRYTDKQIKSNQALTEIALLLDNNILQKKNAIPEIKIFIKERKKLNKKQKKKLNKTQSKKLNKNNPKKSKKNLKKNANK